jgi:pimeloyl-ACP methyl ester carboxylesterase
MTDFLEVAGHRLEHAWHGARGGPTLVFLHEGLGCVQLWRDFPQRLSEATGWPAFVYSRAGYGKSSPPALPRPVRYMHDEALLLPQILAAAGIDDALLFGHSDGASISILHAGSGARVRGLILEAPHVFAEEMGLQSIARAREAYLHGELRSRLARYHENVDAAFWGWNGPWLHPDFRAWNIESSLPAITAPILVVQGTDDEYGTTAQLDAIARGAGGPVERLLVDGAGHTPHRSHFDYALAAAARFLPSLR